MTKKYIKTPWHLGVGDNAIDDALCAIADALGITGYALNRTHA